MVGITFDDIHSFDNYGLILSSKNIGSPMVKEMSVDILGGDGKLDLTEYFGEPRFNNRTLVFTFSKVYDSNADFLDDWTYIQLDFNGRKFQIILDDDAYYYYTGRVSVSYTKDKNIVTYIFTCDCEPFKYAVDENMQTRTGSGLMTIQVAGFSIVPTITTTAETKISNGTVEVNLGVGTFVVPELTLHKGRTRFAITTTGTTTVKYRERMM